MPHLVKFETLGDQPCWINCERVEMVAPLEEGYGHDGKSLDSKEWCHIVLSCGNDYIIKGSAEEVVKKLRVGNS